MIVHGQEVVEFNREPRFEDLVIGKRYNLLDLGYIIGYYFYLTDVVCEYKDPPFDEHESGVLAVVSREPISNWDYVSNSMIYTTFSGGGGFV